MTARIAVGLPSTDERLEKRDPPSPYPSYWNEENHTSSESANTYQSEIHLYPLHWQWERQS